jgi:flagellar protein FliO/FliZ
MFKVTNRYIYAVIYAGLNSFLTMQVYAAEQAGEYLKYHETKPPETSWFSSVAYIFSLLLVFAVVLGLAYLTSQFFGRKMGKNMIMSNAQVLTTLPLGPNCAVYVVEIAGRCMILGVTNNQINLIQEITSQEEIAKLKNQPIVNEGFDSLFRRHLASLQKISQKFPVMNAPMNEQENEREKR